MGNFATVRKEISIPTVADRDRIVETLQAIHFFDIDKLLAWTNRLTRTPWWSSGDPDAELSYTPAMALYLAALWPTETHPIPFAEHMERFAYVLYNSRNERYRDTFLLGHEIHFVHDAVLLLLDQQADRLKTIWNLDQPRMADFPADAAKLADLDGIVQSGYTEIGFADWVLDVWLPAHLLFYGRKAIEAEAAEKTALTARAAQTDRDSRRFHAGGPGDLTP